MSNFIGCWHCGQFRVACVSAGGMWTPHSRFLVPDKKDSDHSIYAVTHRQQLACQLQRQLAPTSHGFLENTCTGPPISDGSACPANSPRFLPDFRPVNWAASFDPSRPINHLFSRTVATQPVLDPGLWTVLWTVVSIGMCRRVRPLIQLLRASASISGICGPARSGRRRTWRANADLTDPTSAVWKLAGGIPRISTS